MKRIFLVVVFVLGYSLSAFAEGPDKALHEQCLYPTVLVTERYEKGEEFRGTAVIFQSKKEGEKKYHNLALTCQHVATQQKASLDESLFSKLFGMTTPTGNYVVRRAKFKDWSTFCGYDAFTAIVVFQDTKKDYAILDFISETPMPVAVLDMAPKMYIGDEVFRFGCGQGEFPRLDYGHITGIASPEQQLYRTSIPTTQGDSGGPIFHKTAEGYKVIAIMQMIRVQPTTSAVPLDHGFLAVPIRMNIHHISYGVPVSEMKNWEADKAKAEKEAKQPKPKVAPAPPPPE